MDTVLDVTEFGNQGSADCMRTDARPKRAGTKAEAMAIAASSTTTLANIILTHEESLGYYSVIGMSHGLL